MNGFERIDRCPSCGSNLLEDSGYDEMTGDLIELVKCLNCGASFGGANYWK